MGGVLTSVCGEQTTTLEIAGVVGGGGGGSMVLLWPATPLDGCSPQVELEVLFGDERRFVFTLFLPPPIFDGFSFICIYLKKLLLY